MNKLSNTVPDGQTKEFESPAPAETETDLPPDNAKQNPTRFGDWEKNGRCIDF